MTVDTFLATYPAFAEIQGAREDGLVQAKLNDAALTVDATVWGGKRELGIGLKAAHLMSLGLFWDGKLAPWVRKDGGTHFLDEFDRHARSVGGAYRLILEDPPE